jgi:hypothetical protein
VPAEHDEFAGDGDGCHLMAAARPDADEEGVQARRLRRRPCCLDQHRTGMAASVFADPPVLRQPEPGLSHPGIETDVAHQLLRTGKTMHIADRRDKAGDRQIDPGDGQQSFDRRIVDPGLGDLTVKHDEVFAEAVEFAQMPANPARSSLGKGWRSSQVRPRPPKQIRMWASGKQVSMQDGVHLILDPRVRDRLDLQRIGDDHPSHARAQHAHSPPWSFRSPR